MILFFTSPCAMHRAGSYGVLLVVAVPASVVVRDAARMVSSNVSLVAAAVMHVAAVVMVIVALIASRSNIVSMALWPFPI